jgi:NAD(P)H-hydrate epimerase
VNERGRRPPRAGRVALPPELAEDAHKGDAGRVLCLAGSWAMPGAALLVVRAACRAGAGLVTLGCLAPELATMAPLAAPEVLLIDLDGADWNAPDGPAALAGRRDDARVAGPGLGRGERTRAIVRWIVHAGPPAPAVLDADALNEVGTALDALAEARAARVKVISAIQVPSLPHWRVELDCLQNFSLIS